MATAESLKAGLTVRNADRTVVRRDRKAWSLRLSRQARAGARRQRWPEGWSVATDFDLTKNGRVGRLRRSCRRDRRPDLAQKAYVRGGFRLNTIAAPCEPAASSGAPVTR